MGIDTGRPDSSVKIAPLRIERPSFAELPNLDYLVRLAQRAEWLLLEVPTTVTVIGSERVDPTQKEREPLVQEAAARLPEHKVWENYFLPDKSSLPAVRLNAEGSTITGLSGFSIRRVVTEQALEQQLALFIAAATEYRTLVNALMARLSRQLDVEISEFSDYYSWQKHKHRGQLRRDRGRIADPSQGEWNYYFHGVDCAFMNSATRVMVEARLGCGPLCGNDFGVLDPGFFLCFINSSTNSRPDYLPLAELLRDWWENASLALEFMQRRGLLRRILSEEMVASGWAVAE